MAFNGTGTFLIDSAGQPVVFDTEIDADVFNDLTSDLANGLSNAICKDGQTTTTSSIPFAAGISAGSITNSTGLAHGTYNPGLTGVTNVDSITAAGNFNYCRIGNQVWVSGQLTVNATAAAATQTTIGVSLPISSNFTQIYHASGIMVAWANAIIGGGIADTGNDRLRVDFLSSSTGDVAFDIQFNYQVL